MVHDPVPRTAVGETDDVLVIDMTASRQLAREHDAVAELRIREELRVPLRIPSPSLGPPLQVRQLDVEDGRLQRIDAEVAADVAVVVDRKSTRLNSSH